MRPPEEGESGAVGVVPMVFRNQGGWRHEAREERSTKAMGDAAGSVATERRYVPKRNRAKFAS